MNISVGYLEAYFLMNTQFKKGVLELCVLSLLSEKDMYGYELVHTISKGINISEGTMYPLLRRLAKEGYFETYLKESNEGAPRKYYKLTKRGIEKKKSLTNEWKLFLKGVEKILEKGDVK
jgi:PadR family transcriptional regulator PadR